MSSLSMREGWHQLFMLAAWLGVWSTSMYPLPRPKTGPPHPVRTRAPSVVLITLDTERANHLACYGYGRIQTPAIDRLALEGVQFNQAYAHVPLTLPSHTVILTGTYPMFNGVRDLTSTGLVAAVPTLAEILGGSVTKQRPSSVRLSLTPCGGSAVVLKFMTMRPM